ncbi:RNA 2',3'-cyclic phosphodiesterase [Lysobacter sp. CFH 32150]|uniref:RNA 2',3'-cyclic phosphodiesterase n=1 Tax=Lysobacter sp. CFH 32150 TaxID=2927128 RepID=UPI001FA792BA|nr:RNA 2',3'-cyclic phosphodiesterase [Lysobacter sp. CFH 32150]MCI4566568.1 RNA 2',3'-cyclic phosphodiesterase [Lysobacter sp. CFH 32150]
MRQLGLSGFGPPVPAEIHRLFFALLPDEVARRQMAEVATALRTAHAPRGRWINDQRYHLTLQFLGDFNALPQDDIAAAKHAASQVQAPAFDLPLDRIGGFPASHVWWLGCATMPDGLQRLWTELGLSLAKARVRTQRSHTLTPHVTVLRNAAAMLPPTPIAPVPWRVREFVLIHSNNPNPYQVLGRWPLPG